MSHRCWAHTARVIELQQKQVLLDMPFKWLQDSHGPKKLLALQEEVEAIEAQFRLEGRCANCGAYER